MDEASNRPSVLAFAGPNGSGKSTVARSYPPIGTYVNADDLKREYGLSDLEAAKQAESIRHALLDKGLDFSFETVLSTERNLMLLREAKEHGYEVECIYVLTSNENINVARVKSRVSAGGHDVPEEKIRARYHRALALLPQLIGVCDKILVYDNSEMPVLIFSKGNAYLEIYPNARWPETKLRKLLDL